MKGDLVRRFRNGLAGVVIAVGCSVLGAAPAPGGLSISTDPDNAAVYVDGRPAGVSPLHLPSVAAGDHRVRIVKSGYLENARLVTVASGASKTIQVTLTRASESATAGQVVSNTGGGGGGSKKWLFIAAAGGAAAAAGIAVSNRNHAPTAATITASPTGTGIAAVTNFSFSAQGATDPEGDSLTLTWNFGDGGSATGATVSHVFAGAGSFNVSVTASDGKAEAKSADVPITIRNVSANWTGTVNGITRTFTFAQSGTSASGSYTRTAAGVVTPGTVTATMTSARSISGTATSTGFTPFTFQGTFDAAVSVLTVVASGSGFDGDTLTFTRQ